MVTRLIITWLCNLFDAAVTACLCVTFGPGGELNPISAFLLQWPTLFVAYKLVLMTILVALLWWKREWKLCEVISWIFSIEYLLVAIYYMFVYLLLASI